MDEDDKGIPWKKVLNYFYGLPSGLESQPLKNEDEFIASWSGRFGYAPFLMGMAIYYLEKQKLIKIKRTKTKKGTKFKIELEPKGFEVAMNNEKHKREFELQKKQARTNKILSNATIIVAIATALSVFVGLFTFFINFEDKGIIVFIILILISLFIAPLLVILMNFIVKFIFNLLKKN